MELHNWVEMNLHGKIGILETIYDLKQRKDFELLKSSIRRIKLSKVMDQKIDNESFKTYIDKDNKIDFDIVGGDLNIYIGNSTLKVVAFGNRNINNLGLSLSIGFETKQSIMGKKSKGKVEVIVLDGIKKKNKNSDVKNILRYVQ